MKQKYYNLLVFVLVLLVYSVSAVENCHIYDPDCDNKITEKEYISAINSEDLDYSKITEISYYSLRKNKIHFCERILGSSGLSFDECHNLGYCYYNAALKFNYDTTCMDYKTICKGDISLFSEPIVDECSEYVISEQCNDDICNLGCFWNTSTNQCEDITVPTVYTQQDFFNTNKGMGDAYIYYFALDKNDLFMSDNNNLTIFDSLTSSQDLLSLSGGTVCDDYNYLNIPCCTSSLSCENAFLQFIYVEKMSNGLNRLFIAHSFNGIAVLEENALGKYEYVNNIDTRNPSDPEDSSALHFQKEGKNLYVANSKEIEKVSYNKDGSYNIEVLLANIDSLASHASATYILKEGSKIYVGVKGLGLVIFDLIDYRCEPLTSSDLTIIPLTGTTGGIKKIYKDMSENRVYIITSNYIASINASDYSDIEYLTAGENLIDFEKHGDYFFVTNLYSGLTILKNGLVYSEVPMDTDNIFNLFQNVKYNKTTSEIFVSEITDGVFKLIP